MRALLELDVPLVIWNSQTVHDFSKDADFDLIMVNSGMAGLPEATSSLLRTGRDFHIVTGPIDDPQALSELKECITAAKAVARLKNAKIGIIGRAYEGMTDLLQDDLAVMETFDSTCSCDPRRQPHQLDQPFGNR